VNFDKQADQTSADGIPFVYVALVLDTQTNGATLNSEDVYTNPAAAVSLACCPLRNMTYTERFKVLKMKKVRIPMPSMTYDGTNIEQSGVNVPFSMYVKLGGLQTKYKIGGDTAVIANIIDNSLHMIAFTNVNVAAFIGYNARLRYVG